VRGLDLEELNSLHGTNFRLVGTYEGGEFGALRLADGEGRRFVLKEQPAGLAPATTDALRGLGYPAPQYVAWGEGYHVQEELPGRPAGDWGGVPEPIAGRLLELNKMQAGRSVYADESWPQHVVESVLIGYSEYMVLATLERHSDESRELLRRCQQAVERNAAAISSNRDIVHWDFTLANVLVENGQVSGVIDWAGTRSGDRLFDLATLIYYTRGETPNLEQYVIDRIGDEGLSVYLAHMAIRQTDWSLRHHGRAAGEQVISYSLGLARRFP
jgi:hypothetical protein